MSFKKCDSLPEYPLAYPAGIVSFTFFLQALMIFYSLTMDISAEMQVLIWLLVVRSMVVVRREKRRIGQHFVRVEHNGTLAVRNESDARSQAIRWGSVVRYPGFCLVQCTDAGGKPLDILIFYRYDRRQHYHRLVRHLVRHKDLSTTGFVIEDRT